MSELLQADIHTVAPLVERREVSPTELLEQTLARIAAVEPSLHAFITLLEEPARHAAAAAEREIAAGNYRGPLHGIPISIKDTIAVAGAPTTAGSGVWADNVTDFDAAVVERLRAAGAVIIGKNSLHEWGHGGTCTDMHFGTVHNPWDLGRVPGGSSGGSAAAVSAGLGFASIGVDGWGSIRTPASYCGVVGLKPGYGLVSRYGDLPPTSSAIHQIGPLTRSVRDAALLLDVLAGHDPRDPTSLAPPPVRHAERVAGDVRGRRVGVIRSFFLDDAVPAVVEAYEATIAQLAERGAVIREAELPSLRHMPLVVPGIQTEAQTLMLEIALTQPEQFRTPGLRETILASEFVREADVRRARQLREEIRAEVRALFDAVDVVLTPVNATPAFRIHAPSVVLRDGPLDMSAPFAQGRVTTRITLPWNLAGGPAISVPGVLVEDEGTPLPVGMHVAARHGDDAGLLDFAAGLEAVTGGYRPPPLVAAVEPVRGS